MGFQMPNLMIGVLFLNIRAAVYFPVLKPFYFMNELLYMIFIIIIIYLPVLILVWSQNNLSIFSFVRTLHWLYPLVWTTEVRSWTVLYSRPKKMDWFSHLVCRLMSVYFPRIFQECVLSVMYQDTGIFILCIIGAVC